MARNKDGGAGNGRSRRRLIEEAQQVCHYVRAQCQEERSYQGEVPEPYRIDFQNSIANYYWALRPMREESVVKEWWEKAELSEHWFDSETGEPYTGLDTIAKANRLMETDQFQRQTMRGVETVTQSRPVVLPYVILEDISGVLDDAAAKLGFAAETPDDDSLPMIRNFDQSRETPTGDVTQAEYNRTPDI